MTTSCIDECCSNQSKGLEDPISEAAVSGPSQTGSSKSSEVMLDDVGLINTVLQNLCVVKVCSPASPRRLFFHSIASLRT
jgi:hypothetical protein